MTFSRRDLFIGGAGIAAGIAFTPVPWKLLGDVSIWTQNWPWIPQPSRGPVESKRSVCTLCAAGCGIRVRMAAGWPVGISGVATNPITKGALCPLAFAAQQLNFHPQRLRAVRHRGRTASWNDAQAAFQKACQDGPLLIVDSRPGRAASSILQAFAATHSGDYRVLLGQDSQALAPYAAWNGVATSALGYDLENARTIVSFGVSLLDGWGTPGRFTRLWSEKAAGRSDPELRLMQIEPSLSRTAARAWRWTAIRPGSDAALAAGLAHVLIEEHLVNPHQLVPPQTSLIDAVAQTGLSAETIRALAHTMVQRRPVVALACGSDPTIAALNVVLGAVGTSGGVVLRSNSRVLEIPVEPSTKGYSAVLLDDTIPWGFDPQPNAEVFRFAAWDGGGNQGDWLLPAPGFLEALTDVPAAPALNAETYSIAQNLLPQPEQVKTPVQFLAQIDSTLPPVEKAIQARCQEIFHAKRGVVFGEQVVAVANFESTAKLEEQLRNGAVWVGEPRHPAPWKCALQQWPSATSPWHSADWSAAWDPVVLPPLATKLYQESDLREAPARSNT
ncbi:MAG TPA: molybdopterin-dependent oxidoreductase [Candidatus Eremiobacteraceae bacterium]|nr:molybdopterin-dependent oxidoreductase [Candidatus Eremiobacteraceae bacterium]